MKWLVVFLFAAACVSSFGWHEAAERNFSALQKAAFGIVALASWALVVVLTTTMV